MENTLQPPFISQYSEYHHFLKDMVSYLQKHNHKLSLRNLAETIGIDVAILHKVCEGKRHLSKHSLPKMLDYLKLSKIEEKEFLLLVKLNRSKNPNEKQNLNHQLLQIRAGIQVLDAEELRFFSSWLNPTIYALLHTIQVQGSVKQLAMVVKQKIIPHTTLKEINTSIKLLTELNLIHQDDDLRWHATEQNISTGLIWTDAHIRSFQFEALDLGRLALQTYPKEKRDIRTLTLHLDQNAHDEILKATEEYWSKIKTIVEDSPVSNQVLQLNLQIFPLSHSV